MNTLIYKNKSYLLDASETVLQCFLRHEVTYPNSCLTGICQSCLIKAKDGVVHPSWQEGLPEILTSQGYFLACLAQPQSTLQVEEPDSAECEVHANILALNLLNHNVMQVKLGVEDLQSWVPGQYLNLINPEGITRSYSIANLPLQEGFIELHVKIHPNGSMGQWLLNHAALNTEVMLRGPFGRCFYHNPDQLAFDMVLAGTGTGLAPLIAIIKNALAQHHQGQITLIHGGVSDRDIYYRDELDMLAAVFPSFVYDPCVLQSQGGYPEASVEKRVLLHLTKPQTTRVYVCGPKETTNTLKKHIFLSGVPSKSILSDVFL
ncbi:FAD-binding oxidoreductase [Legionella worsleiensis]|uniref:Xylene monooxygenase n=1 Tax=Legionella worsleiensis TaxID=45076 RepID=A0A0W1AFN1_9GAMM|nr:FAD-binding oxidoreductase [Legionella worsleiensis]KTD80183.1 xylene monooxygenase [Legionella worsleiensis]STY31780.1 xylene monooxygenase [Legionella worsleiensis]